MKSFFGIILSINIYLFIAIFFAVPCFASTARDIRHVSCKESSSIMQIKIEGFLIVHEKLLNPDVRGSGQFIEFVRDQLKYGSGPFPYSLFDSNILKMIPIGDDVQIRILSVESTAYGVDLIVDSSDREILFPNDYLKKAFALRVINKGDPAYKVKYQAQWQTGVCYLGVSPASVDLILPHDPYLSYFYVLPQMRAKYRWNKTENQVNPCAKDELADLPDPTVYWYFWYPRRSGQDIDGKEVDCENLLREGEQISRFQAFLSPDDSAAKISQQFQIPKEQTDKIDHVKATVIFGWLGTSEDSMPDFKPLLDEVKLLASEFPKYKPFSQRLLGWAENWFQFPQVKKYLDPVSRQFIEFMIDLPEVMIYQTADVQARSNHLVVRIAGRLRKSLRPIEITAFWGPTDQHGIRKPEHYDLFREAMQTSHVVIYSGHAGLGENLKPNYTGLSATKTRVSLPYQVLAILSCYTATYFQPFMFVGAKGLPFAEVTDIIYTGSNMAYFSDASIGLVGTLDGHANYQQKSMQQLANTFDFFLSERRSIK